MIEVLFWLVAWYAAGLWFMIYAHSDIGGRVMFRTGEWVVAPPYVIPLMCWVAVLMISERIERDRNPEG